MSTQMMNLDMNIRGYIDLYGNDVYGLKKSLN